MIKQRGTPRAAKRGHTARGPAEIRCCQGSSARVHVCMPMLVDLRAQPQVFFGHPPSHSEMESPIGLELTDSVGVASQ